MKHTVPHISKILMTLLTLVMVGGISIFGNSLVVLAQAGSPGGPGQPVVCRDGYRNWNLFISSVINYGDFAEYWKDIFQRYNNNICHYEDIDALLRNIQGVQSQIRSAFYACADTTHLKKRYHELEAELFFLRKFIETDHGQIVLINQGDLRRMMREEFTEKQKVITEEALTILFDRLWNKYMARLATYENCRDLGWDALVDKWNQFKESAGGIAPALNQAKQSFEKKWDRMANTPLNLGRSFIGGYVDARLNGLPVKEGLFQIIEHVKQTIPQGYTFEQLQAAQQVSQTTYNLATMQSDYLVQYQTLYQETSDQFSKSINERLNMLNSIVESTYPYQNQTIQCVKTINDRQC